MDRYNLSHIQASFRDFLLAEKISPLTIKNYLSDIRHFAGWYVGQRNLGPQDDNEVPASIFQTLDESTVGSYVAYAQSNNLPEKTINRRLSALRKFFTFCIEKQIMTHNPAVKTPNVSKVPHSSRLIKGYIGRLRSEVINKHDVATDIEEFLSYLD